MPAKHHPQLIITYCQLYHRNIYKTLSDLKTIQNQNNKQRCESLNTKIWDQLHGTKTKQQ